MPTRRLKGLLKTPVSKLPPNRHLYILNGLGVL